MPGNDYSSQTKLAKLHGWCVYVVFEVGGPYSKIGTAANVKYRLSSLCNGNARKLELHKSWRVSSRLEAFILEKDALARAKEERIKGRDWVSLRPSAAADLVEAAALERGIHLEVLP